MAPDLPEDTEEMTILLNPGYNRDRDLKESLIMRLANAIPYNEALEEVIYNPSGSIFAKFESGMTITVTPPKKEDS